MTHIGKSVVFDGELTSDEDLRFDGTLKGHLHLRDATLTIGDGATVEADIRAKQVIVLGTVQGSIAAGERIELTASSKVSGSLSAERVVITEGARFNGSVDMGRRTIATRMAQYKSRSDPGARPTLMHPDLTHVQRLEELDALLDESSHRPLLLFKHSLSCGTSYEALDELIDHLNDERLPARYAMITVQTHRDLSTAIAKRLGVRHETPQALLIRDGRVVWSASHFRVTGGALETAIKAQIRSIS